MQLLASLSKFKHIKCIITRFSIRNVLFFPVNILIACAERVGGVDRKTNKGALVLTRTSYWELCIRATRISYW